MFVKRKSYDLTAGLVAENFQLRPGGHFYPECIAPAARGPVVALVSSVCATNERRK